MIVEMTVLKEKKGIPTVVLIEGRTYILRPESSYQRGAKHATHESQKNIR